MFLPVLAMFTRGQQHNIFPVVDVIQSVPRLRTDARQVSLPLENQQVLPGGRCIVERQIAYAPSFQRVILGE